MTTDNPWRHVDNIPKLVDEVMALHKELSADLPADKYGIDCLLPLAEFLLMAHKFINSMPEVIHRAKIESLFAGYNDAANVVLKMAIDMEKRGSLLRAPAALRLAAEALKETAAEQHKKHLGEKKPLPERPKPKLVLN
jgi:hypothetical protein